ncbi:hypothetical protein FRC00_000355 [Tulasnella sp. 408]|nr:hypothetical protein FRC00_000355 [Tulasnella sp. 408]
MISEPSKPHAPEQGTSITESNPPVEDDENQFEERESKRSSGTGNHPADPTSQASGAIQSSSKSGSGPGWWPFGGGEQLSPLQRRNRELESQVEDLTGVVSSLEKESRDLESHVDHLKRTLSSREKAYKDELSEKESELAELKKTLCMYDECSEAELGKMVDGINTRIQSLARNLAVKWVREASKASDGGETRVVVGEERVAYLGEVVGVQLVNALKGASVGRTPFTPILLQLAWQASIVAVVKKILSCFSASLAASTETSQIENAFRAVGTAVKGGEVQPAYGRWRLVTHQYLRQVVRNEETAVQIYVHEALELCRTATRLAMKNRSPDDESFANALQPQTKEIVEEAFKLLNTLQEKMVTRNYEPYTFGNGRTFRPEKMILDKQDTEYPDDHVVCTTGLGMSYTRKKGRELTSESPRTYVFKKPQVLTDGNLNDMVAG